MSSVEVVANVGQRRSANPPNENSPAGFGGGRKSDRLVSKPLIEFCDNNNDDDDDDDDDEQGRKLNVNLVPTSTVHRIRTRD